MRFKVYESAGTAVVEYLRSVGHDVSAVAETVPQANDLNMLDRAANEKRILVTSDKDFGELIFRSAKAHHGVVLLRLHDESPANRVHVIKGIMEQYADRLESHFTVATESSVRIRRIRELP
ncbi:MAG: DUF5615 family PIN-like protein [Candidatus Hodarchaeota archaeon]